MLNKLWTKHWAVISALSVVAYFAVSMSVAFAAVAPAAPGPIDGQVVFNWGDLVASIMRDNVAPVSLALVGALIHWAPGGTGTLIRMFRIDQLLEKAVTAAINKTAGAVQGKAIEAKIGNEVIERALEYVIFNAPKLYKTNTVQMWRDKILARMNMAAGVGVDSTAHGFVNLR